MALIECPHCGTKASNVLNKCPKCRGELIDTSQTIIKEHKKQKKYRQNKWRNIDLIKYVSILLLVVVFAIAVMFIPVSSIVEKISSISIFNFKESKAIEIVKSSKIQFGLDNLEFGVAYGMMGLRDGSTWLDFSNILVKEEPNKKYSWTARETQKSGIYLVSFEDEQGWGHRWEVSIDQQTLIHVNLNEYLKRKYGISHLDRDCVFKISKIEIDTLKLEKGHSNYPQKSSGHVVYILKAKVENGTGKVLTTATISGKLKVIFKDKTIEGVSGYNSGFTSRISRSNPWNPNTERLFLIKTKGIDGIYLNYQPEYVYLEVNLKAEDPVGFDYNKSIKEVDLKDKWDKVKK